MTKGPAPTRKYRVLRVALWTGNRTLAWGLRHRLAPSAFALLETTGRRTGRRRHTVIGNGLAGDTFWVVAAHGWQSDYVRNLAQEPRVRVLVGGAWRRGTAVVLADDDPVARSRTLPYPWDAAIGRAIATAPLTVRIDLR
ncbi:MAG TPA: nitroreductase/quinone reductase family protein [Lapillicoccus sp.]|nr:nitroreductase/quinone reductase family protein [Lapillicoccus sp.]